MNHNRYIRLAKEGSWIVFGQMASVLGSLVLVRVLTERLKPEQYGQLALGLTVAGLVNQVVMGGITASIGRFYSIAVEKNDLLGYLGASQKLLGYATGAVAILGLTLLPGLCLIGHSRWIGLAGAALLFSILGGFNASLSGMQNAARQRSVVAFHAGLDAWLRILLAVGAIAWLGSSSTAVVIGYAMSSMVMTVSQLMFLRRLIPSEGSPVEEKAAWGRQMWTYSWPFSAWGVFTWAQQVSDRWALEAFATTDQVGYYAVLFQLGYVPIGLATSLLMSLLGPILYQRSGGATDHSRNLYVHRISWRITFLSLSMTLAGFSFALLLHEWIFNLLVSKKYHSVSGLLPWVVLAGGIFAAGQMLALKLMSDMRPASMMIPKIITAITGIALNIILASEYGVPGVVGALSIFSCIYFVWIAALTQRIPTAGTIDASII